MIPPILHRIWLGDKPIPDQFEQYWDMWRHMHPRWTFLTWRDGMLNIENKDVFDFVDTYSEKSDVMRFQILRDIGGVYVDVDVEPIQNFNPLLGVGCGAGWEYEHKLGTAVMLGQAGHPALRRLVEGMPSWVRSHEKNDPSWRTGPAFLSGMWWRRDDVTRFPRNYFFPYGWWDGELDKLKHYREHGFPEETYCVHHWEGSWRNDK